MANDNKKDNGVNVDRKTPPPNAYEIKAGAIKGEFVTAAQSATYAADQEISKKGITSHIERQEIYTRHQGATQKKASSKLTTLMQPNAAKADVATLAQSAITRKNIPSHMMGMSDELLESQLQIKLAETIERRNNATNSIKATRIVNGVPQINKAFDDAVTGGASSTQDAANLHAALNEKRRTGVSGNKIESAIKETQKRRANFTEDAELKKQIDEGTLSRKDVEAKYNKDYSKFEQLSRIKGKLANRAEATQEIRNQAGSEFNKALGQAVFESGGDKSEKDIIKENPALKAAEEALEKLDEQLKNIHNSTANAEQGLLDYNESLAKQERLLKSMPKDAKGGVAGFMGGGGGDAMIEAMGTAAQMYRRHAVGIPMREAKGKAGIANLALSRYNKQFAATQGDMTALYEIMQDRGGEAEGFGKQMGVRSQLSSGVEAGLDTATQIAGIVQQLTGNGNSAASNKTAANIAKIGSKALKGTEALAKGFGENAIVGAEAKLEGILTIDQYNAAIAGIKSQGGQALYNQVMGAADASVGAGNATALEEKLTSVSGMQDAVTRGNLSPEQFIQATAQVGQSVYGANHDRGDIAIRAGEMQKKRVMSADQYTQAMGIQSAAGGSAGGLESTLKRAVAAGVNDSKLLVEFVQLSANLNQSLADKGVSAEGHTAYSNRVQQMKEAGVSEVLATRAAASQIGAMDERLRDTSINEGSVLKAGLISNALGPEATGSMMYYMQTAGTAELDQVIIPEDQLTDKQRKSMDPLVKDIRKILGKRLTQKGKEELGENIVNTADKTAAGTLQFGNTDEANKTTNLVNNNRSNATNKGMFDSSNIGARLKDQSGVQEKNKQNKDQAVLNQLTQAVNKELGGIKGTFDAISKAMLALTKDLDANKAAENAEKAASELDPDGTFGGAVKEFDKAVKHLVKGVGLTPAQKAKSDNASKKPSAVGYKSKNGARHDVNREKMSWESI